MDRCEKLENGRLFVRSHLAFGLAKIRDTLPSPTLGARAPRPGTDVDRAWLAGVLGTELAEMTVSGLDDNRGLVGRVIRITAKTTGGEERKFILKTSGESVAARRWTILFGRQREAYFYNEVAPTLPTDGIAVPKAVYAHGSALFGEYVILLEDLGARGVGVNLLMGNQCWGLPEGMQAADDEEKLAILGKAWESVATVHGKYWNDKGLLANGVLRGADWFRGDGRAQWTNLMSMSKDAWSGALAGGLRDRIQLSPRFENVMQASIARQDWHTMCARLRKAPFSLCHGDFHSANMILDSATGRPIIFDWSEIGPGNPCGDLGQMPVSDLPPRLFPRLKQLLHDTYWSTITGPSGPTTADEFPFELCWDGFCRASGERWVWMFGLLASMPVLPPQAIQYFHDQLLAFIELTGYDDEFFA